MRDDRPPRDIEYKAVTMAPASPAPARRRNAVRTTAVIGPTGVAHRGDLIEAGALAAAVRSRAPRVALGHRGAAGRGLRRVAGVPGDSQ